MNLSFKLNHALGGRQKDEIISLACDEEGIPLDQYWRRRLQDAKLDNCIEYVLAHEETKNRDKTKKEDKNEG